LAYTQPANDNCSNAITLYSDAICFPANQTTVGGSTQGGEPTSPSCWPNGPGINQSVWYKFQATATNMYVETRLTNITGPGNGFNSGKWITVVYNTPNCMPATGNIISCKNENSQGNGDEMMKNNLTGLTVGNWYLIQIGYRTGSFKSPIFCIAVGDDYTSCATCAAPCGSACGLSSAPSVALVTSSCPSYYRRPFLEGGESTTQCYTFTPSNSTINFGLVVNSTCPNQVNSWGQINSAMASSSNIAAYSWTIQPSSTCGGVIRSGSNISSMNNITGLTPGTSYTFCYTLSVPGDCFQSAYYPYFNYPIVLPIELISFTATNTVKGVELNWSTESEFNNDYFSLEHSTDGSQFDEIARITGAGTSTHLLNYEYTDNAPSSGLNYYRLVQNDFNGALHYSDVISLNVTAPLTGLSIVPNPVVNNGNMLSVISDANREVTIAIFDAIGKLTLMQTKSLNAGKNMFDMDFNNLPLGIYSLMLLSSDGNKGITFIK